MAEPAILERLELAPDTLNGRTLMLRESLSAALHKARYEMLSDDGSFYGEIPGFEGVYANRATLEACRDELEEVLEEWIFFRISRSLPLPDVDGKQLRIRQVG